MKVKDIEKLIETCYGVVILSVIAAFMFPIIGDCLGNVGLPEKEIVDIKTALFDGVSFESLDSY